MHGGLGESPHSAITLQTHITSRTSNSTSPVCCPHVSGRSDRLRASLRPFARRCCVYQPLASCENFIGHFTAASANEAHHQTRETQAERLLSASESRVSHHHKTASPIVVHTAPPALNATQIPHIPIPACALLMDPRISRRANQPRVPP